MIIFQIQCIIQQDELMKSEIKPLDDDMAQYWETDMDSSNADSVSVF